MWPLSTLSHAGPSDDVRRIIEAIFIDLSSIDQRQRNDWIEDRFDAPRERTNHVGSDSASSAIDEALDAPSSTLCIKLNSYPAPLANTRVISVSHSKTTDLTLDLVNAEPMGR